MTKYNYLHHDEAHHHLNLPSLSRSHIALFFISYHLPIIFSWATLLSSIKTLSLSLSSLSQSLPNLNLFCIYIKQTLINLYTCDDSQIPWWERKRERERAKWERTEVEQIRERKQVSQWERKWTFRERQSIDSFNIDLSICVYTKSNTIDTIDSRTRGRERTDWERERE